MIKTGKLTLIGNIQITSQCKPMRHAREDLNPKRFLVLAEDIDGFIP